MRGSGSEEWKDEEQQKEASTTPPLHNPQGWGTRGKKREAKSKPAPPANGLGRRLAIAIAFRV